MEPVTFDDVQVGDTLRFTSRSRRFGDYIRHTSTGVVVRKTARQVVIKVTEGVAALPTDTAHLTRDRWGSRDVIRISRSRAPRPPVSR